MFATNVQNLTQNPDETPRGTFFYVFISYKVRLCCNFLATTEHLGSELKNVTSTGGFLVNFLASRYVCLLLFTAVACEFFKTSLNFTKVYDILPCGMYTLLCVYSLRTKTALQMSLVTQSKTALKSALCSDRI